MLIGTVLFCWSTIVFDLHREACSEPLFLVTWLAGMWATLWYLRARTCPFLLVGAVLLGLSGWVRHAGLFAAPVPAVAWLVCWQRSWRRQMVGAGSVLGLAVMPVVLLALVSAACWDLGPARPLSLHPMGTEKWAQLGETLLTWGLPTSLVLRLPQAVAVASAAVALALLAGFVAAALACRWPAGTVLASAALLYLLGLIASVSLADYATPMDGRLLFPLYVLGIPVAMVAIERAAGRRWQQWLAVAAVVYAAASTARCIRYGLGQSAVPLCYDETVWSQAEFVPVIRELPADAVLITNGDYMVSRVTGRKALAVPRRYDPLTRQPVADLEALRRALAAQAGRPIAILDIASEARPYLEPAQALATSLGLSAVSRGDGLTLYAPAPRGAGGTAEPR